MSVFNGNESVLKTFFRGFWDDLWTKRTSKKLDELLRLYDYEGSSYDRKSETHSGNP